MTLAVKVALNPNTTTIQQLLLTTLKENALVNIAGIGVNARNLLFLLFSAMFSTLSQKEIFFFAVFHLPSANILNLVKSKYFLFGKELILRVKKIQNCIVYALSNNPDVMTTRVRGL